MAYPYFVPDRLVVHPPPEHIERGLVKHVIMRGEEFQSFSYQSISENLLIQYIKQTTDNLVLNKIMVVCFRPCAKGESSYISEVLRRGVSLDGSTYRFLGQSKYRLRGKTCYLVSDSDLNIYDFLARFINFDRVENVSKRAGYIGLLLTGFQQSLSLRQNEYVVIKDVQKTKYNFTRGCGYMSHLFAAEIQMIEQLHVPPCVVLMLYQGFYGVLVIRTDLNAAKVEFRESMKKFEIADARLRSDLDTFAVLDYSRPYTIGYLNLQSVMLLADRGVSHDYLRQLQEDYYVMLDNLCTNRSRAAYFLKATGRAELFCKLQTSGLQEMQDELEKLRQAEIQNMKHGDQVEGGRNLPNSHYGLKTRLRVFVPKSRIVFGVCDPYEKLKYGECYFSPTMFEEEKQELAAVDRVVVMRYPCYHPGDVRVLRVQRKHPEYSYLADCIVFPVHGPRPHALECGGGSLGGDKFFVTWDANLVPRWNVSPYDYAPKPLKQVGDRLARGGQSFSQVSVRVRQRAQNVLPSVFGDPDSYQKKQKVKVLQELAEHFASTNSDLVCKLDALFMKYASTCGPSSKECRQLHKSLVSSLAGDARQEEIEKTLEKCDSDLNNPNTLNTSSRRTPLRNLSVRLGLSKPDFKAGDDVWEAMERRAREFLDQTTTQSPPKAQLATFAAVEKRQSTEYLNQAARQSPVKMPLPTLED